MTVSTAVILMLLLSGPTAAGQDVSTSTPLIPCDVTEPNRGTAREQAAGFYGNRGLSVSLGWPAGTVVFKPGGPGSVKADGSLGMKFGWNRGVSGVLTIEGRRLDAVGPPLRAWVPTGYGPTGFQSSEIIFATPGCWEVTGRVGEALLTFVTRVVKIGTGPVSPSTPSK